MNNIHFFTQYLINLTTFLTTEFIMWLLYILYILYNTVIENSMCKWSIEFSEHMKHHLIVTQWMETSQTPHQGWFLASEQLSSLVRPHIRTVKRRLIAADSLTERERERNCIICAQWEQCCGVRPELWEDSCQTLRPRVFFIHNKVRQQLQV